MTMIRLGMSTALYIGAIVGFGMVWTVPPQEADWVSICATMMLVGAAICHTIERRR